MNYLLVLLPAFKSLSFGKRNMCLCISLFIFFVHPCRTRSAPCAPGTPPYTTRSASIGSPPVSVTQKRRIRTANERGSGIFLCREGALCFPLGFRFAPGPDGVPPQMPYPSSSLPSSLSGGCTAYIGKHTNGLLKPPSLLCPVMVLRKRRWEGGRNICGFCFRSCEEEPLCSAAETFPALSLAAPPNHGAGPTRAYDRRRRFFSLQYKYEPNLTICYISANERAYLIVKSVVRLSHPAPMDLVLRKRVCFNVYKRHSLTDRIRRRMGHTSSLTAIGVIYEIVSNIPKVSLDLCNTRCYAV